MHKSWGDHAAAVGHVCTRLAQSPREASRRSLQSRRSSTVVPFAAAQRSRVPWPLALLAAPSQDAVAQSSQGPPVDAALCVNKPSGGDLRFARRTSAIYLCAHISPSRVHGPSHARPQSGPQQGQHAPT
ncbi:hypothetical protein HBH52_199340 [Parastagonospora nodorum]|nr:hypothetical protein HBH52_199340 [Parastagonospora nodorum]